MTDLRRTFGSAKHPERTTEHPRVAGLDDDIVSALGKLSEALEVVENARGALYAFHRMSGQADLSLQDAVRQLRDAGQDDLADEIDDVLVGRDVVPGVWTFQLVEAYDEHYWRVFRAVDEEARRRLTGGAPHVFEAELKVTEQSGGASADLDTD